MATTVQETSKRVPTRPTAADARQTSPLLGVVAAQSFGAFNDNAWKQLVALLGTAQVASESAAQGKTAIAQIALLVPMMLMSLPAGMIARQSEQADRDGVHEDTRGRPDGARNRLSRP